MKVLIINLDKGIFKQESAVLEKLRKHSRFFDKFFTITWTLKNDKVIIENNLAAYPTNSIAKIFYIFDTLRIFKKFIAKEKIDLVSAQDPFETGLAAWMVSRLFKIPLHLQVHTDVFSPYFWKDSFSNKIRVLLAKFLLPKADGIRVVSERIKKSFAGLNLKTEPVVLSIFVDASKIQRAEIKSDLRKKYPQYDFIILTASRFTKEKNIGLSIGAMKEIVKRHPKTGLVIAGSGPEENKLKVMVEKSGLNNNVVFEPWTKDLASYYKSADLFILTSNYEGYGLVVEEAMIAGLPVVMTDVGLAGEIVKNEINGIIVPVGDADRLINAVNLLLENGEKRKNLAEKALKISADLPEEEQIIRQSLVVKNL
ncbi:MAG: glycosyltransferase [Candidatus Pacebacteria bacterium]|nr:glycosyltransferase [Candidatus Paceibacterota bacterium]